jgi:heat shock protein HslJ
MKKLIVLFGWALVLLVLVSGCMTRPQAQQPAAPIPIPALPITAMPPAVAVPQALYGKWILTTMAIQDGTALIRPTTEITLVFNPDGNLTGYGGCNNYFASYTQLGTTTKFGSGITLGPIASTKKFCEINGQQETTYLSILKDTMAYDVSINQLTLTDTSGNVLVFKVSSAILTTA